MAKKKRSNNETIRVIKINRSAVREILSEFFVENQEHLFQLANAAFIQPEIELHFLAGLLAAYMIGKKEFRTSRMISGRMLRILQNLHMLLQRCTAHIV